MATRGTWKKATPEAVDRFHAALPEHPAAERRKMFGYPACFVKGRYFTGLYQDRFVIRLPAEIRGRFPEVSDAAGFDPMGTGAGMRDWYEVPPAIASDDERLADLLARGIEAAATLPPKEPKQRKGSRQGS